MLILDRNQASKRKLVHAGMMCKRACEIRVVGFHAKTRGHSFCFQYLIQRSAAVAIKLKHRLLRRVDYD